MASSNLDVADIERFVGLQFIAQIRVDPHEHYVDDVDRSALLVSGRIIPPGTARGTAQT